MAAESRVPTTGAKEGWTVETSIDHVNALLGAMEKRYQDRFEAQERAVELALTSSREALQAAFAAQREAIVAAFAAQKEAINAALASADRAVQKAENATEKRFESVNEFRGTLDQQQRTLIPRSEVMVLIDGVNEKIGSLTKQVEERTANLTKQIDEMRSQMRDQLIERKGIQGGWGYAVGVVGLVLTVAVIIGAVLTRLS
jgi:hypothetical protein